MDYTGFDRPYVNARLSAESIDLDVASIPRLLLTQVGPGGDSSVIRALGGLDFDLAVDVQQVAQLGLVLKDLVLAAQARDGLINVDLGNRRNSGWVFSVVLADLTCVPTGRLLSSACGSMHRIFSNWPARFL